MERSDLFPIFAERQAAFDKTRRVAHTFCMALETEIGFFESHRSEWAERYQGKFALVHEREVSFFETLKEALEAGYERYGLVPFLVRQVKFFEEANFIGLPVA